MDSVDSIGTLEGRVRVVTRAQCGSIPTSAYPFEIVSTVVEPAGRLSGRRAKGDDCP
jgi:hypothetical protein